MSEQTPELETFIAYRLNQLAERNEHHKFEDIATRIARKRISANILVANGPVSAGGDQQRDSESYTTRIPDELPHSAGFSASASALPVVVACTIQREGLRAKVLADLAGICAEGAAPVDLVTFFSVHSIPEATTHELQRIARETYGVTLNVFSGMKVATMLAERDLVWVARHYLELPSSMVPEPKGDTAPEWYEELLEHLRRNRGPAALTPATQGEVSEGLRFATWDREANADLPEWLDFMGAFLADDDAGEDSELVFRACYEMSVARFRGMGVAAGVEDLIHRAIIFACSSEHPNILDDAVTLASYWGVMWSAGVAQAEASEIAEAGERLRIHVVSELDATDVSSHPVRAASLTGTLAFLHLLPRWVKAEEERGRPEPVAVAANVGVKLDEFDVDTSYLAEGDFVDLAGAMNYLDQLVDLLPNARPYSVRSLSRVFTMFAPALSSQSNYAKVRDGLDAAIAAVEGDAATADKCRNRGVAFVKAGKPLEALAEFHNAKVNWFHGESLLGSVLTMRYIGNLYRDLGLTYAAKMYACSAAVMANQSSDDPVKAHVPKALLEAARAAQATGCWVDAAQLTEVALLAQNSLSTDPFDYDKHPELERHELNELMELVAVREFWPELEPLFEAAHPRTGWYEYLAEQASKQDDSMPLDEEQFQKLAYEQFAGPVLADLGPRRTIDFRALGVRWVFTFDNNRTTVLTAEGFCAAFQVLLADIARLDPVIIKTTVRASIEVAAGASHHVDDVDIDDYEPEIKARITLSDVTSDFDEISRTMVATSFQLLGPVHVRPTDELHALLEPLMRDGIPHKVTVARPYQDSADLMPEEHYGRCAAAERPSSSDGFEPVENEHLAASTAAGPDYDREDALELIHQRYEVADKAWRFSLADILADDRGRAAVARLREDGWLDWQILVAIVNVGLNWRMQWEGLAPQTVSPQQLRQIGTQLEAPDGPRLPLELVLDQLDFGMVMQTATVAQRWKLRGRNERPGEGALRDLLTRRYHYAEDDVPHRDLLDCLDDSGNLLSILDTAPEN
ncbi:hypothetical protein [Blastococcus mobilis]|uniref:Uncharacterized protein n=1 Tax=Blastococcus mobilis TaxID=1938746 RepID=A0A239AP28_9ACTN|nr:hypothetical protein [Blastococcus mobilis]SNR97407.1 hypothetical protein SAMN06272737_1522 [Blastococcus mobilis]